MIERHEITEEWALTMLTRASQTTKTRVIADQFVRTGQLQFLTGFVAFSGFFPAAPHHATARAATA